MAERKEKTELFHPKRNLRVQASEDEVEALRGRGYKTADEIREAQLPDPPKPDPEPAPVVEPEPVDDEE